MKGYLITTGALFALLALAHLARTFAEWRRLTADPGFFVEGPGIAVVAGGLSFWAWRLLRRARSSASET
jgi:CDP-diglyceride synthetase